MHTVVPLFDRGLMLVTDESTENNALDWPKLIWVLDAREETNLVPIATCPLPTIRRSRPGPLRRPQYPRDPPPPTAWQSDQVVLGTFFNGGLRAYDISNPYQPQQVGVFVPPAPSMAPTGTIQLNDVFVDEREIVYTVDRHVGGLYVLEMDFGPPPSSRACTPARALKPRPARRCSICSPRGRPVRATRARWAWSTVAAVLGAGKTTLVRRFLATPGRRHGDRGQRVRQRQAIDLA